MMVLRPNPGSFFPHIIVCFVVFSSASRFRLLRASSSHLILQTQLISHTHTTHLITTLTSPQQHLTHTTLSHTTHIPQSHLPQFHLTQPYLTQPYLTQPYLTQLISHNSLTQLISHNLFSHNSSHTTHLAQRISHTLSHTPLTQLL